MYSHSSYVCGAEGGQRESIFVDVGSDHWRYLFRFFVRDGWLSGRVVFDFARLDFVLNDILLDGLLVGTISRMRQRYWCVTERFVSLSTAETNSLLVVLVSYGCRPLSIDALIFDNVVGVVIRVRLRRISIRFVWNSCVGDMQRDGKVFPLVQQKLQRAFVGWRWIELSVNKHREIYLNTKKIFRVFGNWKA